MDRPLLTHQTVRIAISTDPYGMASSDAALIAVCATVIALWLRWWHLPRWRRTDSRMLRRAGSPP